MSSFTVQSDQDTEANVIIEELDFSLEEIDSVCLLKHL